MDLSIIIAHYDPGNLPDCLNSFRKTLAEISAQKVDYEIEIIIADDGSVSNKDIMRENNSQLSETGKPFFYLNGAELEKWKREKYFYCPELIKWLYIPKTDKVMAKARIGNTAIEVATSENLFFLDDDNYFISQNSIETILNLLKEYQLVIGQVQDSNGRLRPYSSYRVQGTTFAIKKEIIKNVGGFGEWTESVSSGVDSDIWWKLYHYFQKYPELKACYTSQIQTVDSCSKRWKPHIKQIFRHRAVRKEFYIIHGCPDYRSPKHNSARNKSNWLKNLA